MPEPLLYPQLVFIFKMGAYIFKHIQRNVVFLSQIKTAMNPSDPLHEFVGE